MRAKIRTHHTPICSMRLRAILWAAYSVLDTAICSIRSQAII